MQDENNDVRCSNCSAYIIKSNAEEVRMKALIIKWNADGCFAVCKSCKLDIPIDFGILKSINAKFTYEVKEK